jgi:two-component system alkaline phosphatase synthesis response regulator PhoP
MKKSILFIDDEPDILAVTTFRLKKLGYHILLANNGKEGMEIVRNECPSLIFLDLLMPEMDGYQFCKELKKDQRDKDIPIILFTAVEDLSVQKALKETGAQGVLNKPYEPNELLEMIKKFLP